MAEIVKNFGSDLLALDVATQLEKYFELKSNSVTKGFFIGVCKAIAQMRYYQEEGKRIQFRLAVGIDDGQTVPLRLYRLQQQVLISSHNEGDIAKEVYSVIKKVLPCCKDNNDVYITLNSKKGEVNVGIYFLRLDLTDKIREDLLNSRFIIAECLKENLIKIHAKTEDKSFYIKFDLEQLPSTSRESIVNACTKDSLIVRYWKGLFEQVKRCCHGTICLFVDQKFDLTDPGIQKLFTKNPKEIEDLTIMPNLFGENGSMESDQSLQIFLSMLDYDGITIIDILGRVRSYNNFCNNNEDTNNLQCNPNSNFQCQSGSRHIAYERMKKWKNDTLVGIYFQSQEGEIYFYNYKNKRETDHFDAKIMQDYIEKVDYVNIFEKYQRNKQIYTPLQYMTQPEVQNCIYFLSVVQELANTHIGINNFYLENASAQKLKSIFDHKDWNTIINDNYTYDSKYIYLQKETLNVVFACIIGNSYGYAKEAQETLHSILKSIPDKWIINYFNEEYYFDLFLLQDLRFEKPSIRWKNDVRELLKNRFKEKGSKEINDSIETAFNYNTDDFLNFYKCIYEYEQGANPNNC